jgi:putative ABC transport system ATP-binding protein
MLIQSRELGRVYRSGSRSLRVLSDVDLDVAAGEFVAIVGPSGSGKTTLLGLLAGLDQPTSGWVTIGGTNLGGLTEDERARFRVERIGFVFQTFQLIPTLTALENVLVPLELANGSGRVDFNGAPERGDGGAPRARAGGGEARARRGDDAARARELLGQVGLGERIDHYPAQLSGGEQQRVGIARAFANRPGILFADEPTGNLDAETGATVIDLLVDLHAREGSTLLLVTHDPALAARAGRVITLRAGRIVSDVAAPG